MKNYAKILEQLKEQGIEVSELFIASAILEIYEEISNFKLEERVYCIHETWLKYEDMSIEEAIEKYVYGIWD